MPGGATITQTGSMSTYPPAGPSYSFTQTVYGAYQMIAQEAFNTARSLNYSWGQRTGVYETYYYSYGSATRTAPGNAANFFGPMDMGTYQGALTGSVTGTLGQPLTGTATFNGVNSRGTTMVNTGSVTLFPNGAMVFNYTGTRTSSTGADQGTAAGQSLYYPGRYYEATLSGSFNQTSYEPNNSMLVTSNLTGTFTRGGSGTFRAGAAVEESGSVTGYYGNQSNVPYDSITMRGVAADAPGDKNGVMTLTQTALGITKTRGGQMLIKQDGAIFAELLGSRTDASGNVLRSRGAFAATPNPAATIYTGATAGDFNLTSTGGSPTGALTGNVWAQGSANGGAMTYAAGARSANISDANGYPVGNGPGVMTNKVAGVLTTLPCGTLTGTAITSGQVNANVAMQSQGTLTISPSGNATYTGQGNWTSPTSNGAITAINKNLAPGAFFTQTVSGNMVGAANADRSALTFSHTGNLNGNRTGVAPGGVVAAPNNIIITTTTSTPGAFPATTGPTHYTFHSHGVIANGSTSGAMTMTRTGGSHGPNTYHGQAGITAGPPSRLSANLTGANVQTTVSGNTVTAVQTVSKTSN
jgi:hypothetical protein